MLRFGTIVLPVLLGIGLMSACSPVEEGTLECTESWECGDGYTCEVGYCVEIPDEGTGTADTDAVQPEGSDGTVDEPADTAAEGDDVDTATEEETVDTADVVPDVDNAVNECDTDNGGCAQTCTDTADGYTCSCADGYTLNADEHACDDIDECTLNTNPCDDNGDTAATCTNTDGAFTCECTLGYEFTDGSCADIDECTAGTDTCDANATCTNTPGLFTCACNEYYSGDGSACTFCNTDLLCGAGCTACDGATPYCKDNGDNTAQCVQCTETAQCNTAEEEECNAANECSSCPLPVTLGTWASGDDGWSHDDSWWIRAAGSMHLDYTPGHSGSYTQDLTYTADLKLNKCTTATATFSVSLSDDSGNYGSDKSEKLYVQCSGDAGANWTSMTPDPWPSSTQSSKCGGLPGYCAGGSGNDWSFAKTAQTIAVPAACLTAQARFRFHATGSTTWSLLAPGWQIYPVTVN